VFVQILTHTPPWVFALFFGLAYLGFVQARDRQVSRYRLGILPVVMLGLSFFGVWSTFGSSLGALAAWAGAVLAVVAGSLALAPPRGVAYCRASGRFTLPGSWVPLLLMMGIFFTKYTVAVVLAFNPHAATSTASAAAICALSGVFSGVFLARALRVVRVAWRTPAGRAAPADVFEPLRG
jgi:hypothetical protein